jgi:hypothetical protein
MKSFGKRAECCVTWNTPSCPLHTSLDVLTDPNQAAPQIEVVRNSFGFGF